MTGAWERAYEYLPYFLSMLLSGAVMTVIVTAGSFVVAIIFGIISAGLKTSKSRLLRSLAFVYVEVFRSVPVLTQLFIIYFGLATIGIKLNPIPAAVLGFGLNGGAYLTEVFRAGIEAIDHGQTEAALSIGMTRLKSLRYIVLPQATRVVLPPIANFVIGLLKDTSLASAVAAPELSFAAHRLVNETFLSTQIYLIVALLYLAMSLPLASVARHLERRTKRGQRI
ncbi:amino acid ABC transporter permease [Agrobacterium rhizogenes]|nr:amino acid ABC transporter permease [Rhizobium rhizogenes]NTH62056.1 amino acid ABC transporter permease [Rhizobium rhizogenes]NTH93682.1 amino acid ABC transporter permease [Rhizobium rhizogenes]